MNNERFEKSIILGLEAFSAAFVSASIIATAVLSQRLFLADDLALWAVAACLGLISAASIWTQKRFEGLFLDFNPLFTAALTHKTRLSYAMYRVAASMVGAFSGIALIHIILNFDALHAAALAETSIQAAIFDATAVFLFIVMIESLKLAGFHSVAIAFAGGLAYALVFLVTPYHTVLNPAVTIARTLTTTHLTLSPQQAGVSAFAQVAGAFLAVVVLEWRSKRFGAVIERE